MNLEDKSYFISLNESEVKNESRLKIQVKITSCSWS